MWPWVSHLPDGASMLSTWSGSQEVPRKHRPEGHGQQWRVGMRLPPGPFLQKALMSRQQIVLMHTEPRILGPKVPSVSLAMDPVGAGTELMLFKVQRTTECGA